MNIYQELTSIRHNSRYLERYIKFIEFCKLQHIDATRYVEKHHILPKSMFKQHAKSLENIVKLTPRQHFIAHMLLWKTYENYSMSLAFFNMQRSNVWHKDQYFKLTSRQYAALKETIAKTSNTRGTKFYNNGVIAKMFIPGEEPFGFTLGRLNKSWNCGLTKTDPRVLANTTAAGLKMRGKPSWCKGQTKHTNPILMEISKKNKISSSGVKQSEATKLKRRASIAKFYETNPGHMLGKVPWNKKL